MKEAELIAEFQRAVSAVLDGSDSSDSTLQKICSMANPAYEYDADRGYKKGGEGLTVFLKHVHLRKKQFVLKIASKEIQAGKKSKARFFRGAAYMWMLHRKLLWGVPDVIDANFDFGFYVMEYVHGVELEKFCKKANETDNINMFFQILDVVGVIHEAGIVHRDLKPSNIIVAQHPITNLLSPVILDFGISKKKDDRGDNLTGVGYSMGTMPWLAPEQWEDAAVADYRSDIFSLGSILYGMLTYKYRNRFPQNTSPEDEYYYEEDFPTDLLNGKYLTVFMGARASIQQRYQTVDEFKDALSFSANLSKEQILYLSPITGVRERIPEKEINTTEDKVKKIGLDDSEIILDEHEKEITGLPVIVGDDTEDIRDKEEIVDLKELLKDEPDKDLIIAFIRCHKNIPNRKYQIGD